MILYFHFCIFFLSYRSYFSQRVFKDNHKVLFMDLGEVHLNPPSLKLYKEINIIPLRKSIINLRTLLYTYSELNHLQIKNMDLIQIKNNSLLFRARDNQYVSDDMALNRWYKFNSNLPFIDSKKTYKDIFEILLENATILSGLSKLNNNITLNLKQFEHLLCTQKLKIYRNCGKHYGEIPFKIIYKKDQRMVRSHLKMLSLFPESATFLSSFDLASAYLNIKIRKKDQIHFAFQDPLHRTICYQRMPFGSKNSLLFT